MSAWVDWISWGAIALNLGMCVFGVLTIRRSRQSWIGIGELQERARWLQLVQGGGLARFSVGDGREVEIRAQSQRLSPDEPPVTKH